jgi:hypothetical protein
MAEHYGADTTVLERPISLSASFAAAGSDKTGTRRLLWLVAAA